MALAALSGDEQCIIFSQLCNVLDTRVAMAFGSTSSELRALTQAQAQTHPQTQAQSKAQMQAQVQMNRPAFQVLMSQNLAKKCRRLTD